MINIVNRVDNDDSINASHSRAMRFWSPQWVAREMRKLAEMGVKTLRISDEMFFLNRHCYHPILDDCISCGYGFNMWTYSRIDTVRSPCCWRRTSCHFVSSTWVNRGLPAIEVSLARES